jgi:hypothetical protein
MILFACTYIWLWGPPRFMSLRRRSQNLTVYAYLCRTLRVYRGFLSVLLYVCTARWLVPYTLLLRKSKAVLVQAMKAYVWMEVWLHSFVISAPRCDWSASRPCRFNPGVIDLDIHWIGGWMGPRPVWIFRSIDKPFPLRGTNHDCSDVLPITWSLHWLLYLSSHGMYVDCNDDFL